MSDRVLIPLPNVGTLSLTREAFEAALVEGSRALSSVMTPVGDVEPLLGSDQLSALLGVPITWIDQAGREGRIPSIEFGRWRRFRRSAVEAALASERTSETAKAANPGKGAAFSSLHRKQPTHANRTP